LKPAVFLDRDGTINEQMGYVNHLSRFVLLPQAVTAVRLLNQGGFHVVVASNQSGVARGYFPIELVHAVHRHLEELLAAGGARLDAILFCPHHPRGTVAGYRQVCACRKPGAGMIHEAARRLPIDLARSFVVGDRVTDLEMAARADLAGILVKTGYGRGEMDYVLPYSEVQPVCVADDILGAAQWILKQGVS